MKSFNQLLIERIQAYFKKKYGMDIPDEMANEYLDSLAGLFGVFVEVEQRRSTDTEDTLVARGGTPPAPPTSNDSKI